MIWYLYTLYQYIIHMCIYVYRDGTNGENLSSSDINKMRLVYFSCCSYIFTYMHVLWQSQLEKIVSSSWFWQWQQKEQQKRRITWLSPGWDITSNCWGLPWVPSICSGLWSQRIFLLSIPDYKHIDTHTKKKTTTIQYLGCTYYIVIIHYYYIYIQYSIHYFYYTEIYIIYIYYKHINIYIYIMYTCIHTTLHVFNTYDSLQMS